MKKSHSIASVLVLFILLACQHETPWPPISNTPIRSYDCSDDTIYFQNEILPILVSNCAMSGCHDQTSHRDGIVLTDYVSIMNSDIIKRRDADDSELFEVLTETGDDLMPPPPNSPLSSENIESIRKWINQGAINKQCMECDTNQFTFSQGIFPILEQNCLGCHGPGSTDGDFSNYQNIFDNVSLIWSRIDANEMPPQPAGLGLPECEKTIIQKWMAVGSPNN
jgi:hypothetical protein